MIGLETNVATEAFATVSAKGGVTELRRLPSWDPRPYTADQTGQRLFEEIARRSHIKVGDKQLRPDYIAITLPGSIQGNSRLSRCSRLGVMQPIDVRALFERLELPRTILLRDVDCLAIGQHVATATPDATEIPDHIYLFADEGVGSAIFIGGRSYRGAGYAGPIGRLIVEPDGAYNTQFRSQGPLEVFVGRPSLSANMVNQFLTERGKRGDAGADDFRQALRVASEQDPRGLPYEVMRLGLDSKDPVATTVVDRAAHYLGLALSAIITILNPPRIVLAGGVISNLKELTDAALNYARRYSWEQAWNSTEISTGTPGRDHQYTGAALLAFRIGTDQETDTHGSDRY